jgi:hypothetical protein
MSTLDLFRKLQALDVRLVVGRDATLRLEAMADVVTPALSHAIREHKHQLIALVTAIRIDDQAECPVNPTGQHAWFLLTSGDKKCLSCLRPMPETVAANDTQAAHEAA